VERPSVPHEIWTDYTGQPLHGGAQIFGIHLLQFDRNRDVEQFAFTFLKPLYSMREQTAAQHPSQADKRLAFASGALVAPVVADCLAIKAEDCAPERDDVLV
jgi:hypothetical protein